MIEEFKQQLDSYLSWLKEKTELRQVNDDWVAISTPHVDRHNDCIEFYVRREGSDYLLTDDGYTIDDLEQSGCKLESQKRQEILKTTLNGCGVKLNGNALEVITSKDKFPQAKHNFIQAVLAVNDLCYLSSPSVSSLFLEDVTNWLDAMDIRFAQNMSFPGQSGYLHRFDFLIPKSRQAPERLIRVINHPRREAAQNFAFAWVDTRAVRPENSQAYAILNDQGPGNIQDTTRALRNYEIKPLPWTEREEFANELAA